MMALVHWGDTHMVDERGRPLLHEHRNCGKMFDPVMVCSECNEPLLPKQVHTHPGPGARDPSERRAANKPAKTKTGRQAGSRLTRLIRRTPSRRAVIAGRPGDFRHSHAVDFAIDE
jgi:hypothetical protein